MEFDNSVNTSVRQRVSIISFSPIARDARVLRQIYSLAKHFDVTTIGYGAPPTTLPTNVTWHTIVEEDPARWKKLVSLVLLVVGRVLPIVYDYRRWIRADYRAAYQAATQQNHIIIHANDWVTLPLAMRVAKTTGAKVIFDAHEYGPLESEQLWYWKPLVQPAAEDALRRHARKADAMITVCQPIADRYRSEFGLAAQVIMNAPEWQPAAFHPVNPNQIRIVHHGLAMRERKLEQMIRVLGLCDQRFTLDFMLVSSEEFIAELRALAEQVAPGRIFFRPAVPTEKIVETIVEYDLGLFLLEPVNFSYRMALPNKFFEFMMAGLAICIGPSPAMADLLKRYACGCVAPDFQVESMAKLLNELTMDEIEEMRRNSLKAARELNADQEMKKLVALYQETIHTKSNH